MTTALGNPFPCRTALGNPFPCRKVCFAQKAPLDKPPLRLPDFSKPHLNWTGSVCRLLIKDAQGSGHHSLGLNFLTTATVFLHVPSSGLSLATNLAISVRLASVGVGLASV